MDADEKEDSMSYGEDMEVRSASQPSPIVCSCGAYEKITTATKLLRKRIIEAVNDELDQFEQALELELRSSMQESIDFGEGSTPTATDVDRSPTFEQDTQSSLQNSAHCHSSSPPLRSPLVPSLDLVVNKIVANASSLLLSRLK